MFKFGRQARRSVKRPRFVEGAANMGKFLRRGDDHAGKRSRSRFRHPADEADAEVLQHVASVALAPKGAKALRGLREFAANDRLEQFVLGVEISIERTLGDASRARNVIHARAVEAGAQKYLSGALHDLAPFGAPAIDRARVPLQRLRFHT